MSPRYRPGEIIVAQPRLTCRDGDYAVAILTSGERLVKRVFRTTNGWVLHSENALFTDRTVSDDEIVALHRVKHSIQD
jgi:phage repressor protein C with HTH and peptisase S24 domain